MPAVLSSVIILKSIQSTVYLRLGYLVPNETFLEKIHEDDLMSAKVLSPGDSLMILSGLSIPEAGGVTCLVWTIIEKDTEISMRVKVIYLDADAREHEYKNGKS